MGIDPLAVGLLVCIEWLAAGLLRLNHLQGRIGRVEAGGLALGEPAGDHFLRGLAVEDQEGHSGGFGDMPGRPALGLFQVGGVDHHRETGMQGGVGQLMQALVGGAAGIGAAPKAVAAPENSLALEIKGVLPVLINLVKPIENDC